MRNPIPAVFRLGLADGHGRMHRLFRYSVRGRRFPWRSARLPSGVIIPVWPQVISAVGLLITPLGLNRTDTMASVTIEVDLPPDVEISGSERHQK